jgi:acetyl-CoA acetyltransferase
LGLHIQHAGWKIADVERIEINEAFAAIALGCARDRDGEYSLATRESAV